MIVHHLQLDDELANEYLNEAHEAGGDDIKPVLADRLKRAVALSPRTRYLILADRDLARLEKALGGMPLLHAEGAIKAAERLAKIKFGRHELELTPGQLEEIVWTATKQGKSVEDVLQETWRVFCRDFFTLVPHKR